MLASRLNLDDVAGSTGRHANLEGVSTATQAASAVVSKGVDSAVGGFQSVVNEIARPGGDASGANLSRSFWGGVVGGAEDLTCTAQPLGTEDESSVSVPAEDQTGESHPCSKEPSPDPTGTSERRGNSSSGDRRPGHRLRVRPVDSTVV